MACTARAASRLAFVALAAAAAPALAAELEAGVSLRHSEFTLDTGAGEVDMAVSRAGVFLWEDSGPRLRLGLEGGPLLATQEDNPASAGMDLTGYFIALAVVGRLLTTSRLDLELRLDAGYQRAEDDRLDQRVRLAWYEGRAELGASLKLFPLTLSGGGFAFLADGDETASGDLVYTRDFDSSGGGGFVAVDYWVDPTGRISLRGEAGARDGIELQFARRF